PRYRPHAGRAHERGGGPDHAREGQCRRESGARGTVRHPFDPHGALRERRQGGGSDHRGRSQGQDQGEARRPRLRRGRAGSVRISTAGLGIPSLSPSREDFRALAGQGNLVPVFVELPADLDTPLSAYLRLRPGPYSFLLESVEGGEVWARYSFLGTDPLMILSAKDGVSTLRRGDGRPQRLPDRDPLEALRRLLTEFKPVS